MSQAFVKESDVVPMAIGRLHDVYPFHTAPVHFLSKEKNGIRVYEKSNKYGEKLDREVHAMSNGLSYTKDDLGKWYIVE
ncbi:MAG: hypothetical protein H7Y01_15665 [Ferruginibacter sp.]|nr:hypothetical protein [Chitinophagaceae bacterium]